MFGIVNNSLETNQDYRQVPSTSTRQASKPRNRRLGVDQKQPTQTILDLEATKEKLQVGGG